MPVSTLSVAVLSLVLSLAAASLPGPLPVRELARRQVSIGSPSPLPSQCASTCTPVNNEVGLGCPVTACCTTTFETQYYNCLECVGSVLDAGNYSTAQNSLNLLYTTCVDMGFVMPRMELPGQSNSSANATGSASITALFPATSAGSSPIKSATGAAVGATWHSVRAETWLGAAGLLAVAGLW